ncbi:MAG: GatB/YqeY domain-containing protein [bacterium]
MTEIKNDLFKKLNSELVKAMKEKKPERLSVLRMMKSKILYVNARGELPDADVVKIVKKYGNELKDSIEQFAKAGKTAEVEQHKKELVVVQEFLPKELAPEEVKKIVEAVVKETGASSVKDMGNVMKAVMAKAPGIDGKVVNQFVRELLK